MPALTNNGNGQSNRVKVETALSYLDEVKYKYINQPEVYNDFLNIMSEFKSQKLDTPGVIDRVTNLFKDHPELYQGFNVFLPPGYKIDVVRSNLPNPPRTAVSNEHENFASSSSTTSAPTARDILPGTFDHAINFVNKVKERFLDQPDKYRRFLRILHKYQRDTQSNNENSSGRGRSIGGASLEIDVYLEITRLFGNHRDLIIEFGQMLPSASTDPSVSYYPIIVPEE